MGSTNFSTPFITLRCGLKFIYFLLFISSFPFVYASHNNVDPDVLQEIQEKGLCSFIVILKDQADLSEASSFKTKNERAWFVYDKLLEKALTTQSDIIQECQLEGFSIQSFWITNIIFVENGDEGILSSLAQNPLIKKITSNSPIKAVDEMELQSASPLSDKMELINEVTWNLSIIQAPEVWEMNIDGSGVVIGGQDTGYEWRHPALLKQYRGYDSGYVNHNFHWHDAIHTSNSHCPGDGREPCADGTHGTHTMGTALGLPQSKSFGVAPGAKWIGCRNMKDGWGTPTSYLECFQWFLAPTDLNNSNPDPLLSPDVIINSWLCPDDEGCINGDIFKPVVEATRAAGIFIEGSAGNDGPGCESIREPPAIYQNTFSVGATDENDQIAGYSSRGFVSIDGSYRMKPDVVAPGSNIYSSVGESSYDLKNGTSMAGPHVAGLVALMISADPTLRGQVSTLEQIIRETADILVVDDTCNDVSALQVPNHVFGYGRINAKAAVDRVLELRQGHAPTSQEVHTLHDSLNQSLTFPDLNEHSSIHIINPDPQDHEGVEISLFDSWGTVIKHRSDWPSGKFSLNFGETVHVKVNQLFPEMGSFSLNESYSVVLSSNQNLEAVIILHDESKNILDLRSAKTTLSNQLFTPHIASNEQWETRLSFFGDGTPNEIDLIFNLFNHIDLLELFHASRPFGLSILNLKNEFDLNTITRLKHGYTFSENSRFTGSFQFYEELSPSQTISATSGMPTDTAKSIWVAHNTPITSSQWFTGTAISNPNNEAVNLKLIQFSHTGQEIDGEIDLRIEGYDHTSFTSKAIGMHEETSYFLIKSSGLPILATHIFGTEDRQELCALPAVPCSGWSKIESISQKPLYFMPIMRDLGLVDQFFSYFITNPTAQPIEISYYGHTNAGTTETRTLSLGPGEKKIGTTLFPANLSPQGEEITFYVLESDAPILVSVLNGSHTQGRLGGFQAPSGGLIHDIGVNVLEEPAVSIKLSLLSACKKISIVVDLCEEEVLAEYTPDEAIIHVNQVFPLSNCISESGKTFIMVSDHNDHEWKIEL